MEKKKEIKPETLPKAANDQILEASKVLQKNEVTAEEKYVPPQKPNPEDNDPYRSREVAKENPPPTYTPDVSPQKPKPISKNKGRSF